MKCILMALLALVLGAASPQPAAAHTKPDKRDADFAVLTTWFEGSFSTRKHAERDSTITPVLWHAKRIWRERTDGSWFYIEQATVAAPATPYAQRVFRLRRVEEGMIEINQYDFRGTTRGKGRELFTGAWKDSTLLEGITPDDLEAGKGCEIYLQYSGESFFGGTHGFGCKSQVPGTSYVALDLKVRNFGISVWERGYGSDGKVLWGSATTPLLFMRE